MPPDPSLRPDRPRPKQHRIRPTSTPSSYSVPRSFSSPNSRHIFGDENRLPVKSSDGRPNIQRQPEMSESKLIDQRRARDGRRLGSELTTNVDRIKQEQARLGEAVGIKPSADVSSFTKLPSSPSRPLLITGKDQSKPQPTSSKSIDRPSTELPDKPQYRARSPSRSLTPLSSDLSPPRPSQQEPNLPQSPDKPIYVFQSGRPKRRVTIEKEKRKSEGISSQGSSGCSGSQSSGDGSQVKREEEVDSRKEARVDRPKRVRIRDRVKERNRARELRRLRKLDKERRAKEDELRRKRREDQGPGRSSSTSASGAHPENRSSVQPIEVRSSGSGRLTRSRTRVLPLSEIRSYRADSNSAGRSSSSPSSCTSTRSQNHDLRLMSGPASATDELMGPEDIEAALIIRNLSRDARWIAVESKMPSWNMPHGVDTKDPHWNRMDSFQGMKEVVRAWKTCERCGVSLADNL